MHRVTFGATTFICLLHLVFLPPCRAADAPADQPPALVFTAGCPFAAPASFQPQERWAWEQRICLNRLADLAEFPDGARSGVQSCKAAASGNWRHSRVISAAFFAWVIGELHLQAKSFFILPSFSIRCAIFNDVLTSPYGEVEGAVIIDSSHLKSGANFSFTRFGLNISITNSVVEGPINLNNAKVPGAVTLSGSKLASVMLENAQLSDIFAEKTTIDAISLRGANADGQVDLDNARIDSLNSISLVVKKGIFATNSQMQSLIANYATISGGVNLIGAKVFKKLSLNTSVINGPLLMHSKGFFLNVDLGGASISGSLEVNDSVFGQIHAYSLKLLGFLAAGHARMGSFDLGSSHIGENVNLEGAYIAHELSINGGQVLGGVLLRDKGTFGPVDLMGATIGNILEFEDSSFRGKFGAGAIRTGGNIFGSRSHATTMDFAGAKLGGSVDLANSQISGLLSFNGASISGSLFLRSNDPPQRAQGNYQDVDLRGANVGTEVDLKYSTFRSIMADSLRAGNEVSISGASVLDLSATSARISGDFAAENLRIRISESRKRTPQKKMPTDEIETDISLNGAIITGSIIMNGAQGEGALFDMQDANVGSNVELSGDEVSQINATGIVVGRNVIANNILADELHFEISKIDGNLALNTARISQEIQLSNAKIGGALLINDCSCAASDISMVAASIGAGTELNRATFNNFDGPSSHFGNFIFSNSTSFASVDLHSAQVGGAVSFVDTAIGFGLDLGDVSAQGGLSIGASPRSEFARLGSIDLSGSTLAGDMKLLAIGFSTAINASGSRIEGSISIEALKQIRSAVPGAKPREGQATIDFSGSRIGQSLRLAPVGINGHIDLSRVSVGNEIWIEPQGRGSKWGSNTSIDLSNSRSTLLMGALSDWKTRDDKWGSFNLTGFSYSEIAPAERCAVMPTDLSCKDDMYFARVDS